MCFVYFERAGKVLLGRFQVENLTRESLDYLSRPLSDSGSDNQPTSWVFLDGRNPQLFSINWPLVLIHFSFTTYYGQRWRAEKWPFIGGRRVMGINRNGDERKHFPVIFIFLWPKSLLFPLRGGMARLVCTPPTTWPHGNAGVRPRCFSHFHQKPFDKK